MTIHVADEHGEKLQGADIRVEQISKDFPFGSAIAYTIIGNLAYQVNFSIISSNSFKGLPNFFF